MPRSYQVTPVNPRAAADDTTPPGQAHGRHRAYESVHRQPDNQPTASDATAQHPRHPTLTRAYSDEGQQVCRRVDVTVLRDARLGLATGQSWTHITACFREGLSPALRADLERLARSRGILGQRLAERLAPIEIVA
jgi:hypothetical protein